MALMGSNHIDLSSNVYRVEPGVEECWRHLVDLSCGGFGSCTPQTTLYYDFVGCHDGQYRPISLHAFLERLTYVQSSDAESASGHVIKYYCTTDFNMVHSFLEDYVGRFTDKQFARIIVGGIEHYARTTKSDSEGYKHNIAVGTRFFNDIFYHVAFAVAVHMFPYDYLQKEPS